MNLSYRELMEQLGQLTQLPRALPAPWPFAELSAFWSECASVYWEHPFEELNSSVIQYGNLFNYCNCSKAEQELAYRNRPFTSTLQDTIADLRVPRH